MSRCHVAGLGIRNVTCAYASRRSEMEEPSPEGLGRRWVELKVWRRTERGLQAVVEESVVFSTIEVRDKRAWSSRLGEHGEVKVTEYIARIRRGQFERENGASVTWQQLKQDSCVTNSSLHCFIVSLTC